jgi:ABC-type glycerol-3-phosphate transport system permease component
MRSISWRTASSPLNHGTATMPLHIDRTSRSLILQWGQIATGTVIIISVVILFALVQRWLVKGLLAGAVKG